MRAHDEHRDGPPVSGPTPPPDPDARAIVVARVWLQALLAPVGILAAWIHVQLLLLGGVVAPIGKFPRFDGEVAGVLVQLEVVADRYSARNIRRARRGSVAGWIVGILLLLFVLIILLVEVSRFVPFGLVP